MPPPAFDAVLLATPVPGAHPRDELAGLPLALRAALTLQKEGAARVTVVVADGDEETGARVAADPRVQIPVEVDAAASRREALRRRCAAAGGPIVVAMAEVVADPALYHALAQAAPGGAAAVIACRAGARLGPLRATPALAAALEGEGTLEAALDAALADGRAAALDAGGAWVFRADTEAGRRAARDALFEACRKPVDGMISRHLNRHVSIFLSKRIVGTRVTPNQMSGVTFLLAIAAAFAAARGTYGSMLVGAALFQANSILDGVDGELARVRFQQSKAGQWIDTVCDDLSTIAFYAGLAIGARGAPFGRELALCGWVSIGAIALTMAQYYTELVRIGSGDFYALDWGAVEGADGRGARARIVRFARALLKKDFFIFLYLVLAVLGLLPFALAVALVGHGLALLGATARTLRRALARARGA